MLSEHVDSGVLRENVARVHDKIADAARNARMLALALSRRIYDLGAVCTPDENSFGAWQFYIRMIGVSGSDILFLYEVEKDVFQAHLDAAAVRFHVRGQQDRR